MNTTASPVQAPAAATGKTAAGTSLAASTKFKTFVFAFSASGSLVYCICQFFNWPLFTFHPATNRIVWGYEAARSGEGPNMLWYGWTATAILIAVAIGILATLLPERISRKIPLTLIWLLPILAIPYIVYSLMPWWTHH
jgi:hypothetical protein